MKILRSALVAVAFAAATAVAAPASATVERTTENLTGEVIACATHTYTLQGDISIVYHESTDAQGRVHITGTVTTTGLTATDENGDLYRIVGSQWFGGNETPNGGVETFTFHLNVIAPGQGTVDRIQEQAHLGPNGLIEHSRSTCV